MSSSGIVIICCCSAKKISSVDIINKHIDVICGYMLVRTERGGGCKRTCKAAAERRGIGAGLPHIEIAATPPSHTKPWTDCRFMQHV